MAPWLELQVNAPGLPGPYVREFRAPYQSLDEMHENFPMTVQFIGGITKWEYIGGSHSVNDYSVHLRRLNSKGPVLCIDCCTHWCPRPKRLRGGPVAGTSSFHLLKGVNPCAGGLDTTIDVFARLLGPLSLVVVIFVDDFDLPRGIVDLLAQWIRHSKSDRRNRPRIILTSRKFGVANLHAVSIKFRQNLLTYLIGILRISDPSRPYSLAEARIMCWDIFEGIHFEPLESSEDFHKMLFRHAEECAAQRQLEQWHFNAKHLKTIFSHAVEHYAQNGQTQLEIPHVLLQANRPSADFAIHFEALIRDFGPQNSEVVVTVLASALCVDAYDLAMHSFLPNHIFDCVYKPIFSSIRQVNLCESVRYQFELTANENKASRISAFSAHLARLRSYKTVWSISVSDTSCWVCLARSPINPLTCGHRLCRHCVRKIGQPHDDGTGNFDLLQCPLCLQPNEIVMRLCPPTAQIRTLVLAGELNDKAQISKFLNSLGLLISLIGIPFREHFDRVYASGIGLFFAWSIFDQKFTLSKTAKAMKNVTRIHENRWHWKRQILVKFNYCMQMDPWQLCRQSDMQMHMRTRKAIYTNFASVDSLNNTITVHNEGNSFTNNDLFTLTNQLRGSLFYIELEKHPNFYHLPQFCSIKIRCRIPPGPAMVDLMMQMKTARFLYRGDEVDYSESEVFDKATAQECREGKPYAKEIILRVFSHSTTIEIKVQDGITEYSISKCPYELGNILRDQQTDYPSSEYYEDSMENIADKIGNLQVVLGRIAKFTLSNI